MKLKPFLRALYLGHPLKLELKHVPELADRDAALEEIKNIYTEDILRLPGSAPQFVPESALWAARRCYSLLQFAVVRDIDADIIKQSLAEPFVINGGFAAADHMYSFDLSLRFLPDILRYCSSISAEDIVTVTLRDMALKFPLSSVGAPEIDAAAISASNLTLLLEHPTLRALYTERIIETADRDRMKDPRVRAEVKATLGLHPELAPAVHTFVQELDRAALENESADLSGNQTEPPLH